MNINNTSSGKQHNNVGNGDQYNAENITIQHSADGSSDKDKQFLVDLKLTDPRLDKERIERTKGGLWKDSYLWILDNEDFQRWRAGLQNRLLWIRGDPGKGKTMLLCGIVDELHKEKSSHQPLYFFCQATDTNLNTASAVLRGILYLMLKKTPRLIKDLRETYDHCDRQLFEGNNGWDALCSMIAKALRDESFQNTTIIIDALDECITDVGKLLDFIGRLSSESIRVIVSSRNWPAIERGIAAATKQADHISLELNEYAISAAVVSFIDHKVNLLARKHGYCVETRNLVYDTLVKNSNETFLWAALVCQQLMDNRINEWEVELKLREFPPGLDVLYARMLDQALRLANVDLSRRILAVASVVCRPVSIAEMKYLIGPVETLINATRSLEKAVELCGSFLTIRDNIVYFVHQSAKDFLLEKTAVEKVMPEGVSREHELLWMNSLKAMESTFRYNIYDLETPGTSIEHSEILVPDPLAPVRYACIHWIDHISMTTGVERRQVDQVEDFIKHSFLHWAEAVCLLRNIHGIIGSMIKLSDSMKDMVGFSKLIALVQDASWFLRQHRQVIEKTPLQIYWSVLLFSPRKSIIRKLCMHQVQNWFLTKPLVRENNWNTLYQVLGHHNHSGSLKFSPDGSILASKSFDNIKLWDVITGRCLRTIRFPGMDSGQVTFSASGLIVATVIEDNQCMIWNTTSGECLQKLQVHSGKIKCVALSPDGRTLAMGSSDTTVKLWDTENGRCVRTLEGHKFPVSAVEFSPDGRTLASAATNIKIWNAESGECVKKTGLCGEISAICYTQKGRNIVSVQRGRSFKDVEVHRTSTGNSVESFARAFDREVQISPQVVASDRNFTDDIEIWSVETGETLATIPNREGFGGIAISNDGKRLATVVVDGAISLWDLTAHQHRHQRHRRRSTEGLTRRRTQRHERKHTQVSTQSRFASIREAVRSVYAHKTRETRSTATSGKHHEVSSNDELTGKLNPIQSVNFSGDGQKVVSVRQGYSPVEVWETRTGRRLQKLRLHATGTREPIYIRGGSTVAFSEDSRVLLALKGDLEVDIWDATKGSYVKSLHGCGRIYGMAFSGDATRLAISAQNDIDAIQIWSLKEGRCICEIKFPEPTLSPMLSQLGFLHFWFSQSESELHTRLATIDLSMVTSQKASFSKFKAKGYYIQGNWIMKDTTKMVWLPKEYRPWRDRFAVRDSALAIGCESGRVITIQFA